jgi:hypothetical protein
LPDKLNLKDWLHRDLVRADKLLLALYALGGAQKVSQIKASCKSAGFKVPQSWNVSSILSATKGRAINTDEGWELTDRGRMHLETLGVGVKNLVSKEKAEELSKLIKNLKNNEDTEYLNEAMLCIENELYRAAVVMTWSAAMHFLKKEVVKNHLNDFNTEAVKANPKWRTAKTSDDLGLMRERDFLDRLVNISLIGKDVKDQLQDCLTLRNSCGHPNSLKIEKLKVASCVETLILNVFQRFCV